MVVVSQAEVIFKLIVLVQITMQSINGKLSMVTDIVKTWFPKRESTSVGPKLNLTFVAESATENTKAGVVVIEV